MKNYIRTIKYIDNIIGSRLVLMLPKRKDKVQGEINRLLVVRPGGMGDAALLAPILKMVKSRYPAIRLDILCEKRNEGIFQSLSFVDSVFNYQALGHMLKLIRNHYDLIVDTEQSHFLSAVVCRFLRGDYTIGFKAEGRERMFHYTVNYSHAVYESEMFLALFRKSFDLPDSVEWEEGLFKQIGAESKKTIQNICAQGKDIVCLFPGATIPERLWPVERWAKVVDFLSGSGRQCVLLGGKMEIELCQKIQSLCSTDSVMNMSGKLSLLETAWLFKQSMLLVSTDSGILHLGVICNLPTVSLFGSGIQEKWGPKGHKHTVISSNLSCSPCTVHGHTPPCTHGNQCMMDIQIEMVINGVKTRSEKEP